MRSSGRSAAAAWILALSTGLDAGQRPVSRTASAAGAPADTARPAKILAIRHEALPGALRVTLELDREVPFVHAQIDGPPRLVIDLPYTRPVDPPVDGLIPVHDDLVRQIRLGRQADARTRVVLDLSEPSPYSVYALYHPIRLTIDVERAARRPAGPVPLTNAAVIPPALLTALPPRPLESGAAAPSPARPPTAAPPPAPAAAGARPATPGAGPADRSAARPAPAANGAGGVSLSRQLGLGVARIAIDPGHGGHDPGAKVGGLTEAGLVLDVALRLERLLLADGGFVVVLTRRTDVYVPLEERTALANREGADLFLSIHANASSNAATQGVETYFLDFALDQEAEATAARENASSARSMRELPDLVRTIALHNKLAESRDLAGSVQTALYERLRKTNRNVRDLGVKQAPFMVLIGATMPGVLAEVSFVTSRQDAALLRTDKYRQDIAAALMDGVRRYRQSLKKPPVVATR